MRSRFAAVKLNVTKKAIRSDCSSLDSIFKISIVYFSNQTEVNDPFGYIRNLLYACIAVGTSWCPVSKFGDAALKEKP